MGATRWVGCGSDDDLDQLGDFNGLRYDAGDFNRLQAGEAQFDKKTAQIIMPSIFAKQE